MELVTLTAAGITTLIVSEAAKEFGKNTGKSVSEQFGKVLTAIRDKFSTVGTEGLLTRVQNQPTEKNKAHFQDELETQMTEDKAFGNLLQKLMQQPELAEAVREDQVIGEKLKAKGSIELDHNTQETTHGKPGSQKIGSDIEAGESIKISNNSQRKL
ncbi:MAG: hypothetical protein KME49_21330 [Brasilonema octagenarum HA4186-MV1]|jgi:hypothetical protein|nr:hypothetical protein [Brasilonema octagenarum HA4186-MV1]